MCIYIVLFKNATFATIDLSPHLSRLQGVTYFFSKMPHKNSPQCLRKKMPQQILMIHCGIIVYNCKQLAIFLY